ncbi:hypothetical protein B0H14DRAFT_2276245, partial [Mycena olivaceomarginata]
IGDLLADGTQAMLECLQPYPGDELIDVDDRRRRHARFKVSRVSEHDYLVWDEFFHEIFVLPARLLLVKHFQVGNWFAVQLCRALNIPKYRAKGLYNIPVDDLLAGGAENYLH